MRTQSKATLSLKYILNIMKFCGNCKQNFKVVAKAENVFVKTIELWSKQLKIAEQCCQICPSVNLQLKSRTQLNMIGNTLVCKSITKVNDCYRIMWWHVDSTHIVTLFWWCVDISKDTILNTQNLWRCVDLQITAIKNNSINAIKINKTFKKSFH